jgi:DnaJ-class molecular chaperone
MRLSSLEKLEDERYCQTHGASSLITVVCPSCQGAGKYPDYISAVFKVIECPRCNGLGYFSENLIALPKYAMQTSF